MLLDQEGHRIIPAGIPNSHLMVSGQSGCGKTYFLCQKVSEYCMENKKACIIDVSDSYSLKELEKGGFPFIGQVICLDPNLDIVTLSLAAKTISEAAKKIVSALSTAFGIYSYQQKRVLLEVCKKVVDCEGLFSFPVLIEALEKYLAEKLNSEDSDAAKQSSLLLSRFDVFSDLDTFMIAMEETSDNEADYSRKPPLVTVVQLSSFDPISQVYLSALFLEVYWMNTQAAKRNRIQQRYDVYLVDEFQNLAASLRAGCAIYRFLREGRKYKVSVVLSSQFLSDFDDNTQSALLQCGTSIYFHPDDKHQKSTAKLLSQDYAEWEKILRNLNRGYAVLKGTYFIDDYSYMIDDIIKVKVVAEADMRKE